MLFALMRMMVRLADSACSRGAFFEAKWSRMRGMMVSSGLVSLTGGIVDWRLAIVDCGKRQERKGAEDSEDSRWAYR